jgi:type II secretory pathway component PulK
MERGMSILTLILLVALAACAVVAAWNSWQLASKADSRSEKFRPLAKIAAGAGGMLIVLPLVTGIHGWVWGSKTGHR